MRKIILKIRFAVLATVFMTSCITKHWDPAEDLRNLTEKWAYNYIDDVLKYSVDSSFTLSSYYDKQTIGTSVLKDTLSMDFIYRYSQRGDSVNVSSGLLQIKDSIVVTTNGYIYADKFWAHLFTKDSGIVNYKGIFHVDFYETGKTTPWAWSDITYIGISDDNFYSSDYYSKGETKIGWY